MAVSAALACASVAACGGDDDTTSSPGPDGSTGGGAASGGDAGAPSAGGGGAGNGGDGGTSGASVGGGGAGGQPGGAGGTDGGSGCALACVHGSCVAGATGPSCACDSPYTGALCDEITSPPSTGIAFWLDADDNDTTGGGAAGPLPRWEDKSAAGAVALAGPRPADAGADAGDGGVDASVPPLPPVDAGADADAGEAGLGDDIPTLRIDASSGRRTVVFDGNDCMRVEPFAALTGATAYDVFVAGYGTDGAQVVLAGYAAAGQGLRIETTATSYRYLHRMPFGNNGGDSLVATQAFSRTGLDLLTAWRDGTEQSVRRPGNTVESIAASSAAFDEDLTLAIGCLDVDSPSRYLVGEIAEILVYQGGLSDADRDAVEDYLSRKWLDQPL